MCREIPIQNHHKIKLRNGPRPFVLLADHKRLVISLMLAGVHKKLNYILVGYGGQPDISTRRIVNIFRQEYGLPIVAIIYGL